MKHILVLRLQWNFIKKKLVTHCEKKQIFLCCQCHRVVGVIDSNHLEAQAPVSSELVQGK